jgi:hypothetical protein
MFLIYFYTEFYTSSFQQFIIYHHLAERWINSLYGSHVVVVHPNKKLHKQKGRII